MVGMIMAMIGAVSASIGVLLIKSGGKMESHLPWYKRVRWLSGFTLQAGVSAVTDTIAYSTCPLSLISPFAGLTIVFSAVWAMLGIVPGIHEKTSYAELSTIALIFAGVTFSSIYGPRDVGNGNLDRIATYLHEPAWVALWCAQSGLIIAWTIISAVPAVQRVLEPKSAIVTTFISGAAAAACAALTQCFLKVPAMLIPFYLDRHVLPVSNGWVWMCVGLLILYAINQLYLINVLMSRGRVMLAVPIFSSLNLLLTMTSSAVLFGDFENMSHSHRLGFTCGSVLVVIGIFILPQLQGGDSSAEDEGASDTGLLIVPNSSSCMEGWFCRRWYVVPPKTPAVEKAKSKMGDGLPTKSA
eukprot:CAMPEP_0115860524 /NCGR_PEP_ID=MMETSP0287-20121206/17173_1 /TAXON_ID=412157 /ORGANISM="Chrysochromulina rotalis, Strain UIO044" /LENGTH=355 /DNA_ID=CAMNT_0003314853 /DNA_START=1 /DNA_END=1068 /DNA_ORIENTATION=-